MHQAYRFWHRTSFISTCLQMCSTALCRPVLWEGKSVRAPLCLKQLIRLHFAFINLEMSFIFSIYRNGSVSMQPLHAYYVLYALLLRQHLVSPHRGIKFARFLLWYSSVFGILELVTWHFLINKVC